MLKDTLICRGSYFLGTSCGNCSRCIIERKELLLKITALDNCYMMARRQLHRLSVHRPNDESAKEPWLHIVRFCEDAGLKSSVLR